MTETGNYPWVYRSVNKHECIYLDHTYIYTTYPMSLPPEKSALWNQLVLYLGNRCNRPCYTAVIPMTLCSLPFYHRSPLYTLHIKRSNAQREIPWHKCALTTSFHTYAHKHRQLLFLSESLTHTQGKRAILYINDKYNTIFLQDTYVSGATELENKLDADSILVMADVRRITLWIKMSARTQEEVDCNDLSHTCNAIASTAAL